MGRSLRSKSKLRAKSIKRKGEFSKAVDERTRRLAEKSARALHEQAAASGEQGEQAVSLDSASVAAGDESMAVDKKVSTSGWRDSRKQIYKQRKLKKKKVMKF